MEEAKNQANRLQTSRDSGPMSLSLSSTWIFLSPVTLAPTLSPPSIWWFRQLQNTQACSCCAAPRRHQGCKQRGDAGCCRAVKLGQDAREGWPRKYAGRPFVLECLVPDLIAGNKNLYHSNKGTSMNTIDIVGELSCGLGNTRGEVGCCLNMLGTGLGLEALDSIAGAGLDYLELSLRDLVALGKQVAPMIVSLESIGLPCRSCNNLFPGSIHLLGSMFDESIFRLYLERAFDAAAASGARVVVFGSGEARHAGGRLEADWLPELADRLHAIAGMAAQYGILVAIEPLNYGECDTVNNLNQAKSLAALAGCANVGLLVDSYHMLLEGESPGDAANYGPSVVHVHLSAGRERRMPRGNDSFPSAVLSALFSVGYHGRVSIEALSRDPFEEVAEAVKFIRAISERVEQDVNG